MTKYKFEVVGEYSFLNVIEVTEHGLRRYVVRPNDDLTDHPQEVLEAVKEFHTPEVKATYQAHLDEESKANELADDQLIEQGVNELSSVIDANYTTKMWKVSEYDKKRNEAEYILGLESISQADADKCRLITDEADERGVTILELAVIIQYRVIAYEAMIKGERKARKALETQIPNVETYETKLAIKQQIVDGFKAAIGG